VENKFNKRGEKKKEKLRQEKKPGKKKKIS